MIRLRLGDPRIAFEQLLQGHAQLIALPVEAARDALSRVAALLDRCGADWWITYGTLLGAVREGGFIAHDGDIDIAIRSLSFDTVAQAAPAFELQPFWISHLDGVPSQLKLMHTSGIMIDLYGLTDAGRVRLDAWPYENVLFRNSHPIMPTTRMEFAGVDVRAPSDAIAYVTHLYGRRWRRPLRFWHWALSPSNRYRLEGRPRAIARVLAKLALWRARVVWRTLTGRLE